MTKIKQILMVMWSGAHIKGVTERCCSGFLSDVPIDEYQQPHFFNRPSQHELDVSCPNIAWFSRFDAFLTGGITSKVWSDVQKK